MSAAERNPVIVHDGPAALQAVREQQPAVVLLDGFLPGHNGLDTCLEVRGFSRVPLIMLTAKVEEVDRPLGLDSGADDYLCKPYRPREVVARVKAQLRRVQWHAAGAAQDAQESRTAQEMQAPGDPLRIDESQCRAWWDGHDLDLTPAELRLLRTLSHQPGRVFSRDQLLQHLHDDGRAVTDRTVDSHIRNIRRRLEQVCTGGSPMRSVYGVGCGCEGPAP